MKDGQPVTDMAGARPSTGLRPFVSQYVGYRFGGHPPGTHLGLPSASLTVVLSLSDPTRVRMSQEAHADTVSLQALAGGLHTKPALIVHDGSQYGVQLAVTPAGSRALFGMPAGELAGAVVPLEEVFPATVKLLDRMAAAPGWSGRFAVLDEILAHHLGHGRELPAGPLPHAWRRIARSKGRIRVGEIASEIGWSRRHLAERFRQEYGITPKEAARVSRFERARRLLERPDRPTLADAAAISGYADQSHLSREWNDLAGCPPSQWIAEEFPFVQDGDRERVAI